MGISNIHEYPTATHCADMFYTGHAGKGKRMEPETRASVQPVTRPSFLSRVIRPKQALLRSDAVPDLRFPHEIEAASLDHGCPTRKPVRAEEDRRAEDPFERADQPAVLLSTGVHSEILQIQVRS